MSKSGLAVVAIDLEIKTEEVYACVFTRDGWRAITGAQENPVRVWDVEASVPRPQPARRHQKTGVERGSVQGTDGIARWMVHLWDVETGRCLRCSKGMRSALSRSRGVWMNAEPIHATGREVRAGTLREEREVENSGPL